MWYKNELRAREIKIILTLLEVSGYDMFVLEIHSQPCCGWAINTEKRNYLRGK